MMAKQFFKSKTQRIRHFLVKLLAPTVYNEVIYTSAPRPMIRFIKRNLDGELTGAEIGVLYGENAENMLETLPIKKLYLIDPYLPYLTANNYYCNPSYCLPHTKDRLSKYDGKAIFVTATSADAARYVPNNLDFVYVDGDHSYESVKKDLRLYYPKVRKGGVIGGHDFSARCLGLVQAVKEFQKETGLPLYVSLVDWWFVK